MHWQMTRPKDFDPGRRYPVIVYVYGGPTGQRVTESWESRILVEQYWVQQGYLVFTLDNRGVQHYGKAFQEPVYKRLGVLDAADQLRGVEWLKRQPYVDAERIGVFGWSYGGYLTLMMLMQSPGSLAAGAAVAPVTDWALYDTHYTERYMGTPQADPEVYRQGDVLTYAGQLSDPLLLLHGMADDNVLFAHSTRLMENLQQAAIPFGLMTYPGGKHSLVGENIRVHVYTAISDFFDRHLKP
jgi:dipeptidyl-peptidase-4